VLHQQYESIALRALNRLTQKELELLFRASVADGQGRRLTEPEWAARQAYRLALRGEYLWAGRRSTEGLGDTPPLRELQVIALAGRLSNEDLKLVISGMEALREDRALSAGEAAALQTYQCEWQQLCEMAVDLESE